MSLGDVDPDQIEESADALRAVGFPDLADRLDAAADRARELEADG